MVFTIGGNILSAAMVVVVFSIFAVALAQTWQSYLDERDSSGLLNMTLALAEQARDHILENTSPLDDFVRDKHEIMNKSGADFSLEIRDMQGKVIFGFGQDRTNAQVGVYLPISFNSEPCELAIGLWRV